MWRALSILAFLALFPMEGDATGLTGVWGSSGNGVDGSSAAYRVAAGSDGSIVTAGTWGGGPATLFGEPFHFVDEDVHRYLSKHASDGTLLWIHEISAAETHGLAVDADGNIALCGRKNDPVWNPRGFVAKYDADGDLLWESILDGCCDKIGVDVAFTSDGGIAAIGFWDYGLIYVDSLEVIVDEPVVAATLRYAPDGTLLWYHTQGTVPAAVLVGPGDEVTEIALSTGFRHFDADGTLEWEKSFWTPTGWAGFGRSVIGPGGDIFAAGSLRNSLTIDGILLDAAAGEILLVRLGSDGTLQWASQASGDVEIQGLAVDGLGNSSVLVKAWSSVTYGGTVLPGGCFLAVHDPSGTPILVCALDSGSGSLNALARSPFDGSILVGGQTDGSHTTAGIPIDPGSDAHHAFLVKIASPIPTGVPAPHAAAAQMQAFPNPFNPQVTIRYTVPLAGDVSLDIHSVDGARVRSLVRGYRTAGTGTAVWDGHDDRGRAVSSGIYVAVLRAGEARLAQKVTLLE